MKRDVWLDTLSSIVLALTLAVVIWVAAVESAFPVAAVDFPVSGDPPIPLSFVGLPDGLAWYAPDRRDVTVRVRGLAPALANLDGDQFEAVVDLAHADPTSEVVTGTVTVRCRETWDCLRAGVRVERFQPTTVSVRVGRVTTSTQAVTIVTDGDPSPGFALTGTAADPAAVTLRGAAAPIARVVRVVGAVGGLAQMKSRRRVDDVRLEPRDGDDRVVDDIEVLPAVADVVLNIVRRGVPAYVTPEYVGKLADGFLLVDFLVDPQVVQLQGPQELVNRVDLSPIVDISGLDHDDVRVVPLDLPAGVSALNAPEGVTVTVKVAPLLDAQSLDVPVLTQGLADGLEATVEPEVVRVLLNGPRAELDALRPEDLPAVLGLTGRDVGTFALAPLISPPAGISVRSIQPNQVEVVIRARRGTPRAGAATVPAPVATSARPR